MLRRHLDFIYYKFHSNRHFASKQIEKTTTTTNHKTITHRTMCQENQTHIIPSTHMRTHCARAHQNRIANIETKIKLKEKKTQIGILDFNSHSSFTLFGENDLYSNYSNWCINIKLKYPIALLCYLLRRIWFDFLFCSLHFVCLFVLFLFICFFIYFPLS